MFAHLCFIWSLGHKVIKRDLSLSTGTVLNKRNHLKQCSYPKQHFRSKENTLLQSLCIVLVTEEYGLKNLCCRPPLPLAVPIHMQRCAHRPSQPLKLLCVPVCQPCIANREVGGLLLCYPTPCYTHQLISVGQINIWGIFE